MANKKIVLVLLTIISFVFMSCNSVKVKNSKLNSNIIFQHEKDSFLTRTNKYVDRRERFELIFLYRFNDSVFISSDNIELFADKVVTNDITDNPNISFLLNVEKYKDNF